MSGPIKSAWHRWLVVLIIGASIVASGCASGSAQPTSAPLESSSTASTGGPLETPPSVAASEELAEQPAAVPEQPAGIMVDTTVEVGRFDRRLLGTNVQAWLAPSRLRSPDFHAALEAAGVTLIRMPGGSWSNHYDWLACEMGSEEDGCFWTWAARPSDFVELLERTGHEGMWTVSINETAQHSAALVAFFNGEVDDRAVIGLDRTGRDWGTVADWAQLRAEGGHPEPVGIALWEVGNEVYGAKIEAAGPGCAEFGWEDVWTCEGNDYVLGTTEHDGYLDIRAAMLAVDPSISVGAVGVPETSSWGDWGTEVIESAGDDLDFYVVHQYGFDESPGVAEIVERPAQIWPEVLSGLDAQLPNDVPIAVTEHNLVSVPTRDTDATMVQASNALFLAETLGQLAYGGVPIANHWDFASGTHETGTNYGLVDADALTPFPTFFSMVLWSRFGETLHPVVIEAELAESLRAYAATGVGGTVSTIIVNRSGSEVTTTLSMGDGVPVIPAVIDTVAAERPSDPFVTFNGIDGDSTDVIQTPGLEQDAIDGRLVVTLPAWSISLVRADLSN